MKKIINKGDEIISRIYFIRGRKVMLDSDLARIYGVTTARLNQQVKRNQERFPSDFMFELTYEETQNLMLQIATSSFYLPHFLLFANLISQIAISSSCTLPLSSQT